MHSGTNQKTLNTMKTKVFKFTNYDLDTIQAIANVDIAGLVFVHYINAFEPSKEVSTLDVKCALSLVEKWAKRQKLTMYCY